MLESPGLIPGTGIRVGSCASATKIVSAAAVRIPSNTRRFVLFIINLRVLSADSIGAVEAVIRDFYYDMIRQTNDRSCAVFDFSLFYAKLVRA